jgi:hypothetical protein
MERSAMRDCTSRISFARSPGYGCPRSFQRGVTRTGHWCPAASRHSCTPRTGIGVRLGLISMSRCGEVRMAVTSACPVRSPSSRPRLWRRGFGRFVSFDFPILVMLTSYISAWATDFQAWRSTTQNKTRHPEEPCAARRLEGRTRSQATAWRRRGRRPSRLARRARAP